MVDLAANLKAEGSACASKGIPELNAKLRKPKVHRIYNNILVVVLAKQFSHKQVMYTLTNITKVEL